MQYLAILDMFMTCSSKNKGLDIKWGQVGRGEGGGGFQGWSEVL